MTSLRAQVGALIRLRREKAGLTQAELADRAGRSLELVGRIERGVAAPSFDTLEEFGRVLDVSVSDFFRAGDYKLEAGDRLSGIMLQLTKLNSDDLKWVEGVLNAVLTPRSR